MTNNDAWLKVLEQRVEELKSKEERHRKHISVIIDEFREWVSESDESSICYDAEYKAQRIAKARETYKSVWAAFKQAEAELDNYKNIMGF